jgi:anti-sigma regulatory factor (Ser/Thr protein kinase)
MSTAEPTEFPATLESLSEIRRLVERWCRDAGASAEDSHAVVLAVDEVCTNIVEHGYAGREGGTISVRLEEAGDELRVLVGDRGAAFDPAGAAPPDLDADWQDRPIGGLGWHLVRGMVDDLSYRSEPDGNLLTLVKRLKPQPTTGAT